MRSSFLISGVAALALLGGCHNDKHETTSKEEVDQIAADKWFVTSAQDTAVKNGIIAQHTIYAYHFVPDSAQLNDLGVKELMILSDHFKANSGQLNVRQGDASEELYKARLQTINAELRHAGVVPEHVVIADNFPGGKGMRSERVVKAIKDEAKDQTAGGGSSSSETGNTATPVTTPGTAGQP